MTLEEQDREQEGIVGWIIGIAAFIAVAISLWMGLMGAFNAQGNGTKSSAPLSAPTATAAPAAAPTAPMAPASTAGVGVAGSTETVSLFFEVNKTAPPADAAQKLDGLVVYARSNPNTKLGISGYADKTGDPVKNAELAKERAMAVKNQLISAGVPEDRIMLQKPKEVTGDKADDKEARRVDVYMAQ
jgi:K(+)-stimulated pyrophosphate-energized sodium pump